VRGRGVATGRPRGHNGITDKQDNRVRYRSSGWEDRGGTRIRQKKIENDDPIKNK